MKRTLTGELLQLAPIVAMFVAAALCWSHVPDRMPIHWNIHGEVDGYGGKFVGLLLMPIVGLGVYLLTLVIPFLDPGRANYQTFAGAFNVIRLSISLFLAAVYAVSVLTALGYQVSMNTVIGLALGVMFVVMGNVMGKIRPNWFVGVRTPWTLSSKESWTKTHRLAGWLFIAMGLLAVAWALVQTPWMFVVMMTIDGACMVWIVVYSYLIYRSDPARTSPSGTSPAGTSPGSE